ncbi:hypothetical protein [Bacillus sp. FJAT-27251]|uniref:hypothetical protein n=1 Tax=Bacillus sp. FJAT-27251 TaxID=1684142 RepID=UPI0006A7D7E9|nr:hypothetical protein [Bacillus sp. FJAT-27251]
MQSNLKQALLIGAGAAAAWVAMNPKDNINKVKDVTAGLKEKLTPARFKEEDVVPVVKAGNPDPLDVEDNKMVSEGSMYGVNYYNENLQEK